MRYLTTLNWIPNLNKFSDDEQKILLALSHEKYRWRTKERIISSTGLTKEQTDSALAQLISKNEVRPSISKKKNLIFGLRERVDK